MIQEVGSGRRRYDEDEPAGVGIQRRGQAPAPVVDQRRDTVPRGEQDRTDEPVNNECIAARACAGDRQRKVDAGNTVYNQVPRAVRVHVYRELYSSAASSSAWCSW